MNVKTVRETRIGTIRKLSSRLLRMLGNHDRSTAAQTLPRLLIVDDEESICFSMSDYFQYHGYLVDSAQDIRAAEKLVRENDYKVLIQDLQLGVNRNPNGLEIVKMVHNRYPQTRIIVLTAYGSAEMENAAKRCGADAFLSKPKPLAELAQVAKDLLESRLY